MADADRPHDRAVLVPYVLDRVVVRGIGGTIAGTIPDTGTPQSGWAQRMAHAHYNAIENLVIFASAILIAHALNISTPTTRLAVVVYFFARLLHFLVYATGLPALRTLTFTAGWLAQIAIIVSILGWA